jgi:hypothetical protein
MVFLVLTLQITITNFTFWPLTTGLLHRKGGS